jgi:hypothetical protein
MKNDLTTGAWQHDIGCPISIVLFSTSDVSWLVVGWSTIRVSRLWKVSLQKDKSKFSGNVNIFKMVQLLVS